MRSSIAIGAFALVTFAIADVTGVTVTQYPTTCSASPVAPAAPTYGGETPIDTTVTLSSTITTGATETIPVAPTTTETPPPAPPASETTVPVVTSPSDTVIPPPGTETPPPAPGPTDTGVPPEATTSFSTNTANPVEGSSTASAPTTASTTEAPPADSSTEGAPQQTGGADSFKQPSIMGLGAAVAALLII
ncbi:hypothetical protein CLAFUW4_01476 [Fulvia fulva]|uniref:Uncharacterized protein n=1 Tax=Passalora fulva TaxID=5499 RepID=A0A9Q8P3R8_PASFU|nr:uncharacterized protein CLAFUR5_01478 [Fulvia fulva]KAK4636143.1 hypothetical protein CLAFUR4_01477 [Fulvia fulva]KAK4637325.1 hypothetical protein CLAFUR0_01478 [Fulvia fulva]UJO12046.1 hypothetical protein CLAFUR5_01478 [Fulvia fulva]WPV08183.1 hypothetical protein CLAFUW4_01476 [Fulvia fulva]WPV24097.1 hypothetical protein CLAFUW7_01481 [Fulvia fulva]